MNTGCPPRRSCVRRRRRPPAAVNNSAASHRQPQRIHLSNPRALSKRMGPPLRGLLTPGPSNASGTCHDLREEPGAGKPLARIREGKAECLPTRPRATPAAQAILQLLTEVRWPAYFGATYCFLVAVARLHRWEFGVPRLTPASRQRMRYQVLALQKRAPRSISRQRFQRVQRSTVAGCRLRGRNVIP